MRMPQHLSNSLRREGGPEKWTVPEKITHCDRIFRKRSDRIDEGTIVRQALEQWDATLFDELSIYTNEEEKIFHELKLERNPLTTDMKF